MHGFRNNGNTCYFNSAVQCLLQVRGMSEHIMENVYTGDCQFTTAYRELVRIYHGEKKPLKIDIFPLLKAFHKAFPRFGTPQPHDAQDAIFCIVDILEASYPYIKTLIYGEQKQETIYPGGKKVITEPFSMLLLHGKDDESVDTLAREREQWHTLTDYVDDEGKKHNVATVRTSITKYPRVLFVSFDKKVRVTVGDALDRYEVVGSIIHVGSQYGGHYMSMMKLNDAWILQDNTMLTQVDFPETHDHHVLMYNLKNPPS